LASSGFTVTAQGLNANRSDYFHVEYVAGLPEVQRDIVL
jgi:hypothetical protein